MQKQQNVIQLWQNHFPLLTLFQRIKVESQQTERVFETNTHHERAR